MCEKRNHVNGGQWVVLAIVLACTIPLTAQVPNTHHYRMISAVEYLGQGQFRNQVETVFSVTREPLAQEHVRFSLQSDGLEQVGLSFVVNRKSNQLSDLGQDMRIWAQLSNESIRSMRKISRKDVGRTWKQEAPTGKLQPLLGESLTFTVTAVEIDSETHGAMVAVRALSEPFSVQTSAGPARAKVNSAYLFDADLEEVYLSVCVFETATMARGFKEILHSEVVTLQMDAAGHNMDFTDCEDSLGLLLSKVGLLEQPLEMKNPAPLPQWVRSDGLTVVQAAQICASNACEGAVNPVSSISMPAVKVIEIQKDMKPNTTETPLESLLGIKRLLSNRWVLGGIIATAIAVPIALHDGGGGNNHVASP